MDISNETQERIILAALQLFFTQGIKKTAMAEVADQAGVTRVTAYRYFGDKKSLVRAAFMRPIGVFQQVQKSLAQEQGQKIETYLDSIGMGLAALPQGDLPTRLDELNRLYPDIADEFHTIRLEVVKNIFDRLFTAAREQGLLREGVRQEIIEVVFMETATNALENPRLVALNLSSIEIYNTIKHIFLYGILKEQKS
ncbi:MAG: TetR/AcrR family transcriptional regulator [Anaerolineaceae bacterium]|nr:TetR/AcrR family transcriptional regulator [Anaerolineaceae bacterium]